MRCAHGGSGRGGTLLARVIEGSRVWLPVQRKNAPGLGYQWIEAAGEVDLRDEIGHSVTIVCRKCGRVYRVEWDGELIRRSDSPV